MEEPHVDLDVSAFAVFDGSLDHVNVLRARRQQDGTLCGLELAYSNPVARDVHGMPTSQYVGRRWEELYPEVVESGLFDAYRRVLETGEPFEVTDFEFSATSGGVTSTAWLHIQATRFGDSVVTAYRDVTVLRQSAETLARERAEAEVTRRAFLPDELATLPGLHVAAAYLPANESGLGGDWYDSFVVADRLVLVVGDVAGHGLQSVVVMGLLRNATRAYAVEDPSPAKVVERLNRLLCQLEPAATASIIVALWDPATGIITRCNAGHPPVLRCRRGETAFLLPAPGVVLGADPGLVYEDTVKRLRPGTTLLFYSDGLIESRERSLDEGMAALKAHVEDVSDLDPQLLCNSLLAWRVAGAKNIDDMCILAVRLA